MRKLYICILIVFLISNISCQKNKYVYDEEKIAKILTDVHLAEMALGRYLPEKRDSLLEEYIKKIDSIHEVDYQIWKREIELMQDDGQRYSDVYEIVVRNLQEIETENKRKKRQ